MKVLPLTKGHFCLVDDADLEAVSQHHWHAVECDGRVYARRSVPYAERAAGTPTVQYLHAFLTGWSYVDHLNGLSLDNRRSNLRQASAAQNVQNQPKRRGPGGPSHSQYKGVSLFTRTGRWRAAISVNRRQKHLGYFATEEEAARAYDRAALEVHGEFARLNLPQSA